MWSRRTQHESGLPSGRLIYSDTSGWQRNEQALFSRQHGVTGKPDYLINDGENIVPIELKSSNAPRDGRPRLGHVLQLATYCLLIEENYGTRPSYGIIKYADQQFAVDYDNALEAQLLDIIAEMRDSLEAEDANRNHAEPWRCATCGVRHACDQALK